MRDLIGGGVRGFIETDLSGSLGHMPYFDYLRDPLRDNLGQAVRSRIGGLDAENLDMVLWLELADLPLLPGVSPLREGAGRALRRVADLMDLKPKPPRTT